MLKLLFYLAIKNTTKTIYEVLLVAPEMVRLATSWAVLMAFWAACWKALLALPKMSQMLGSCGNSWKMLGTWPDVWVVLLNNRLPTLVPKPQPNWAWTRAASWQRARTVTICLNILCLLSFAGVETDGLISQKVLHL